MISGNRVSIIIPARYGSTRLPAKPLLEVAGKPIIQWVWEKALKSKYADDVIIAVDDKRIFDACMNFGAEVEMTDCATRFIYSNINRFRQIVKVINKAEKLAKANGLNSIDEVLIKEAMIYETEATQTSQNS